MNALTGPRISALRLAVVPAWLLSSLLCAQQPEAPLEKQLPVPRHAVVPDKELLITHRAVTESAEAQYPGALSFGYAMEQLAGREHAAEFTHHWLRLWLDDQEVNRDIAPARPRMAEVLEEWRRTDQGGADDPFAWTPNLAHAPFKLIAVVNRMDLVAPSVVERIRAARESAARNIAFLNGEIFALPAPKENRLFTELGELFHRTSRELPAPAFNSMPNCFPSTTRPAPVPVLRSEFVTMPGSTGAGGYGSFSSPFLAGTVGPSAGEGRLVFALTDAAGRPREPGFNVIFEYGLTAPPPPAGTSPSPEVPAREWAARWHRLGTHAAFDAAYLRDLVAVTKCFTDQRPPLNSGERPLPPSLAQVRTNDGVLDAVREFREFHLVPGDRTINEALRFVPARLRQVPVGQTPAERYREPAHQRALAKVLETRVENFRKEAPVNLPAAVQWAKESEPAGLLGARSLLPGYSADFHWSVSGLSDKNLQRHFSLHTCNGCHGGDTHCDNGCHLKAGPDGTLASVFLALRPDGRAEGEMRDRAAILKALLESGERDSETALVRLLHRRHRGTH